jgi:hypothetical protein
MSSVEDNLLYFSLHLHIMLFEDAIWYRKADTIWEPKTLRYERHDIKVHITTLHHSAQQGYLVNSYIQKWSPLVSYIFSRHCTFPPART